MSLYRQKTKAALVIQLAWRRYIRRKRHRLAAEAEAKALQVCVGNFYWPVSNTHWSIQILSDCHVICKVQ